MAIEIKNMFGTVIHTVEGSTLAGANLSDADLCGANLSGANLSDADLYGADLSGADLSDADLSNANLYGANLFCASLSNANLSNANLSNANLHGANLSNANLSDANLYSADLYGANLSRASLSNANLSGASLYEANLSRANLYGANLSRANLSDANLYSADLSRAKIELLAAARLSIVPESGSYIGWKKCEYGVIVKLLIPETARRSNATGRKCRAEFVEVLEVIIPDSHAEKYSVDDEGRKYGQSMHDGVTRYYVGATVCCDNWCEDRWEECAGGIHHFITRAEAEAY